jgi:hypothetical protein
LNAFLGHTRAVKHQTSRCKYDPFHLSEYIKILNSDRLNKVAIVDGSSCNIRIAAMALRR